MKIFLFCRDFIQVIVEYISALFDYCNHLFAQGGMSASLLEIGKIRFVAHFENPENGSFL